MIVFSTCKFSRSPDITWKILLILNFEGRGPRLFFLIFLNIEYFEARGTSFILLIFTFLIWLFQIKRYKSPIFLPNQYIHHWVIQSKYPKHDLFFLYLPKIKKTLLDKYSQPRVFEHIFNYNFNFRINWACCN